MSTKPLTYKDAGVDIDAGNSLVKAIGPLAKSTARAGADGALGGFGGLFDLKAAGYTDPILVAANDGVGTKLKIAIDTGIHDTIGIDLVAMSVNDLLVQGAEPLFFLDYFACGHLETNVATDVVAGIADGCKQAGCALIGGETAEMPGMYADGDYDLGGFAVGAAERGTLLPSADIAAGDVLLGLTSSGPHSNGYSLIRRLVADQSLAYGDPAPFNADVPLGRALLEPTVIYALQMMRALKTAPNAIKAMAHITGGGLPENIPRALPEGVAAEIDLASFEVPSVFRWIYEAGRMERDELLRTFNCGIGLVLIVRADMVDAVRNALSGEAVDVRTIGHLVPGNRDQVAFKGEMEFA